MIGVKDNLKLGCCTMEKTKLAFTEMCNVWEVLV